MKLDELVTRRAEPLSKVADEFFRAGGQDPDYIITNKLAALGWTFSGKGCFSNVYTNPKKNYVLKLNYRGDDGFLRYANIVRQHPNKHFPVISALKTVNVGPKWMPIYRSLFLIEKLGPIRYEDAVPYISAFEEIMTFFSTHLEDLIEKDTTMKERDPKYFNNTVLTLLYKNPELLQALQFLGQNKGDNFIDMHTGNIMHRKDGTIVITDPYS